MYKYYQLIERIANLDPKQYKSIAELTKELAIKAGYHRDMFTFKNGNKRERTFYDRSFDDVLTAKWFMYYKKLFFSKLSRHPEMSEYYSFILNRTFLIVMQSYRMDIAKEDNIINKNVNMALANRIGEVLYIMGSSVRMEMYQNKANSKEKNKLLLNTAINHMAQSLDKMYEEVGFNAEYEEKGLQDILIDLRNKLSGNKFGAKLLDAMLSSNKKIQPSHIDDFIYITRDECTEENKSKIVEAWNDIESILKTYVDSSKYKWGKIKKVGYSFEKVKV